MNKIIRFASIGDCCADIYDDGTVKLGGTAYNVALAASKAGAHTSIISAIGTDSIGNKFLQSFKKNNIDFTHLTRISGNTDTIKIKLVNTKPTYSDWKTAAIKTVTSDRTFLRSHDAARAVLFTSTKRLFDEFCSIDLRKTLKIGDFAGTSLDSYPVSIIKQYAKSLDVIIKSVEDSRSLAILQQLSFHCLVLALLGKRGSIVFTKNKMYKESSLAVQTKNTTGAGDVYQAYFVVTYLQTKDIQKSMKIASQAAAKAIS
ncbi:MAG: PfkB protein [uncultured bacterium]|uniref:Carbohydrate kinase PfkB domain-containing protein n=1 Tax=Candidatus Gottesmanbacteria bacterium RIFCSPLOWO2_01_FULL_43_11b TaxID=1798392 RepID=A0A1F6AFU8_9BACT|nr:MAG: PfkB protein [uncultured bacterium]OGG23594.1 MAG: hypothetical protein A3A79_00015 [Candidatus Gottesmanbacteria bacterium RIFCSPLOWO2_01_FULL_43_11b]